MSDDESIERYRDLLTGKIELDYFATDKEIAVLQSFTVEDHFYLAKSLLSELVILKQDNKTSSSRFSKFFKNALLKSLVVSTKISHEDYRYIINNSSLLLLAENVIINPYFPIEFLLYHNVFESHFEDPLFPLFETHLEEVKSKRSSEIIPYAKRIVHDSNYMSDEMVLSVAGITL